MIVTDKHPHYISTLFNRSKKAGIGSRATYHFSLATKHAIFVFHQSILIFRNSNVEESQCRQRSTAIIFCKRLALFTIPSNLIKFNPIITRDRLYLSIRVRVNTIQESCILILIGRRLHSQDIVRSHIPNTNRHQITLFL